MNIFGCFFAGSFVLAASLSQTGLQLTIFRGLQGTGAAMYLPTAFSIISKTIPTGRRKNVAFACLGLGQPLGWFLGLLVGGICEGSAAGWRLPIYLTASLTILLGLINIWSLPDDGPKEWLSWNKFYHSVDWVGLFISSTCFGTLSYAFA
jgi:MFS family permease